MKKKGQAAMEFLMTYGWAILAAVIVIAVLASFGVFSPGKYVPQTCIVSAPFGCVKNQIAASDASDTLTIVLTNGGGENTNITGIDITDCTEGAITATLQTDILEDGEEQTYLIPCNAGELIEGEKFNGDLQIDYLIIGGTLPMTSSGSITVEVGA
jgi:uncharacterized protein (UPF0333 family)